MKKYLLFALVSVLGFAACSDIPEDTTTPTDQAPTANFVRFSIAFPFADPVPYTKVIQTSREWAVDRLDVYQFDASTHILEAVYENVTLVNTGPEYSLTLQVDGQTAKNFLFVANNVPGSVNRIELPAVIGTTNESAIRAAATNVIASASSYIEPTLMMTGELTGINPSTDGSQTVYLTRVMARFDILNYEPTLTVESIKFHDSYSSANLFGTGYPSGVASLTYDARALPSAANLETDLIQRIDAADHINYKHAIYVYPQPVVSANGPRVTLSGYVTKSPGTQVPWSETVDLKADPADTDFIGIVRNYRYTLKINKTISGKLSLQFIALPWINDEDIDHRFIPSIPSVSYTGGEYVGGVLTAPATGAAYTFGVAANTEWTVSYRTLTTAISTDFSQTWVSAAIGDSASNTSVVKDQLVLTLDDNSDTDDRELIIRLSCKADPQKFMEFKVLQAHP